MITLEIYPASQLPRTAAWLGYGGLLPFVVLTYPAIADPNHGMIWADALIAYGAVILTFVGALHWGFAMLMHKVPAVQRRNALVWSILPALLAWPALMLPVGLAALLLATGLLIHFEVDRRFALKTGFPHWYRTLRFRLTLIASTCLLLLALMPPACHGCESHAEQGRASHPVVKT